MSEALARKLECELSLCVHFVSQVSKYAVGNITKVVPPVIFYQILRIGNRYCFSTSI